MNVSNIVLWAVAFTFGYIIAPVSLIWGWVRWFNQPKPRAFSSATSLVAFILASASAAFGLLTVLYGMSGAFEEHYEVFYRVVGVGAVISLLAILVAVGGLWRKSPLRWLALASALGTLGFWADASTWP
jgi:hypothetical protein